MGLLALPLLHVEAIRVRVEDARVVDFEVVETDREISIGQHVVIGQRHIRLDLDAHVEEDPQSDHHLWIHQCDLTHNIAHEVVGVR